MRMLFERVIVRYWREVYTVPDAKSVAEDWWERWFHLIAPRSYRGKEHPSNRVVMNKRCRLTLGCDFQDVFQTVQLIVSILCSFWRRNTGESYFYKDDHLSDACKLSKTYQAVSDNQLKRS